MTNTWIGVGRLARDPELRYTPKGTAVANLRIAVPRIGEDDTADFFDVVTWDKQAEACAEYLTKGRQVLVEGRLRQQTWQDKDTNENRSRVEITAQRVQFLDGPRQSESTTADDDTAGEPAAA